MKEELVLELAGMMREMGRRRPRRLKARDQQMTRFTPVHRCLCLNEVLWVIWVDKVALNKTLKLNFEPQFPI